MSAGAEVHRRDFPRDSLEAAGYGSLVYGQKTWNGVALLARGGTPVEVRRAAR